MSDKDSRIHNNSRVLEKIAAAFPAKSLERRALKASAFAFMYVILHHEADFDKYVKDANRPLTKTERAKLKKLGLD